MGRSSSVVSTLGKIADIPRNSGQNQAAPTSQSGVEIMISGGFQRRQVPTVSAESSREEEVILPDSEIKERF